MTKRAAWAGLALCVCFGSLTALADDARAAQFDRARAWTHLKTIVAFGPRPVESTALEGVRNYIRDTFESAGATVEEQPFVATTPRGRKHMTNVWGVRKGSSDRILIISAHYESKDMPDAPTFVGANDSASGVAVVLALAEATRDTAPPLTVWFVCYDGEEAFGEWSGTNGLYGSRAFVQHLEDTGVLPRVAAAINLDMIGDEHLRIVRDTLSTPELADRVWAIARERGHARSFTKRTMRLTDDHTPFLEAGVPALGVIDFQYGPLSRDNRWWHTASDTLAHCRADSLGIVGDVMLTFVLEDPTNLLTRTRTEHSLDN